MKLLIFVLLFASFAAAQIPCESAVYGKVASDVYEIIPNAGPVIAVGETGQVYSAAVDRGGFDLGLVPCGIYRIGVLSTRRYYFETVRIDLGSEAYRQDFIGVRKGTWTK